MKSLKEQLMAEARNKLEHNYTDYGVIYHGATYIVYSDHGGVHVSGDEDGLWYFETYDEMLKAPIFWGHRLEEIIESIKIDLL